MRRRHDDLWRPNGNKRRAPAPRRPITGATRSARLRRPAARPTLLRPQAQGEASADRARGGGGPAVAGARRRRHRGDAGPVSTLRIVIAGFGRFPGAAVNPSGLVVLRLTRRPPPFSGTPRPR